MPAESKVTTNHEEIRRWIEERGGHPSSIEDTAESGGQFASYRLPQNTQLNEQYSRLQHTSFMGLALLY
jgi:hypothetical protein